MEGNGTSPAPCTDIMTVTIDSIDGIKLTGNAVPHATKVQFRRI